MAVLQSDTEPQYMASFGELSAHLHHDEKYAHLDAMLDAMGIDVERIRYVRRGGPSIFFAEQPGLTPNEYHNRTDLVRHIRDRFHLNPELSREYVLSTDGYSGNGDIDANAKKIASYLAPLPDVLNDVPLASARYRKGANTVGFREMKFSDVQENVRSTFSGLLSILEGSGMGSLKAFRNHVKSDPVYPNVKPFLQKTKDAEISSYLASVSRALEQFDVGKAVAGLRLYYNRALHARANESWASYWSASNELFYRWSRRADDNDQIFASIDPLLSEFVLAIKDPKKLGMWLGEAMERTRKPDEDLSRVPIVGYVDDDARYKTAYFDRASQRIVRGLQSDDEIPWSVVQQFAQEQRATPAYVLKYLLRAGADMYFVMDDRDAKVKTAQDEHIHGIYAQTTGLVYPAIRCPTGGPENAPNIGYAYLGAFGITPETRTEFSRVLDQLEHPMEQQEQTAA